MIEGSSNITVEANVAHDTAGHCFYIGSDARDNTLLANIGSVTNKEIGWGQHVSGRFNVLKTMTSYYFEDISHIRNQHHQPPKENQITAVLLLYFTTPRMTILAMLPPVGKVKGKQLLYIHFVYSMPFSLLYIWHSYSLRFGIYNDWRTLGEDNVDTGKGSIRRVHMKTFKNNKAHSNMQQGFAIYDFEQFFNNRDFNDVPVFENVQSYRNREHGIYSRNLVAAQFIGGTVADNQWYVLLLHQYLSMIHSITYLQLIIVAIRGFVVDRSDHVLIEGMTIKGLTDTLSYITTPVNRMKVCSIDSWTHEGLRIMTNKDRYGESDPNRGLRIKNVAFSDFGECLCLMQSLKCSDTNN